MKRLVTSLSTIALGLGGLLAAALPASALGTTTTNCTYYVTVTGYSSSNNGGFTTNGDVCGIAKVRLAYGLYSGSPTYYTSWVTSSSTAFQPNPGNIVYGGNHGVSNPALLYTSAKNFNS